MRNLLARLVVAVSIVYTIAVLAYWPILLWLWSQPPSVRSSSPLHAMVDGLRPLYTSLAAYLVGMAAYGILTSRPRRTYTMQVLWGFAFAAAIRALWALYVWIEPLSPASKGAAVSAHDLGLGFILMVSHEILLVPCTLVLLMMSVVQALQRMIDWRSGPGKALEV